jgi:methyl-accepting chemotaxis protein
VDTIGVLTVIALILWILLSLVILGGLVYALPTLRRLSDLLQRMDRVFARTERDLEPVLEHLRRSADDMDYVTSAIRSDVEAVGDTVDQAARSTQRMLRMAEERAVEINGFLEVVQEEAEETFLSTASLLRALRGSRGRGRRSA